MVVNITPDHINWLRSVQTNTNGKKWPKITSKIMKFSTIFLREVRLSLIFYFADTFRNSQQVLRLPKPNCLQWFTRKLLFLHYKSTFPSGDLKYRYCCLVSPRRFCDRFQFENWLHSKISLTFKISILNFSFSLRSLRNLK